MGKKTTKRRTIWKSLPLTTEEGGECSEDDVSTTSSGRSPGLVLRMRSNRHRALSDREPLVKLESKTFDQEEYTKITTPRQDVLFKKGYFARKKLESSIEESVYQETEEGGEPMEQMIITNGFVDERGHYLVNGNSYEIYDPYTNTVTVVVGPPPYTNGITPPVLAAVSCQPVPLQPVDWYPPGGSQSDWHHGPAWTPAYPKPDHSEEDSPGSDEPPQQLFPPQPFVFQNLLYPLPIDLATEDRHDEDGCSKEAQSDQEKETAPQNFIISNTPLKPTVEEFIPSSHMNLMPPTSSVLKKPAVDFVPQPHENGTPYTTAPSSSTLRPTGAVFVPRQQSLQQHTQSQDRRQSLNSPQEAPSATPSPQPPQHPPVPALKDRSPPPLPQRQHQPKPTAVTPAVAGGTPKPVPPKAIETDQAKETATQIPERVSAPIKELTPPSKEVRQEPINSAPAPAKRQKEVLTKVTEPASEKPMEDADSFKEIDKTPVASPRRSYAKMLSNGLDVKPNEQPQETRDNNESIKRIVQNGTILTNGHDDRLVNGKETAKNARNIKETKRINRQDKSLRDAENGYNYQNGTSPLRIPKDKIINGEQIRKDAKEVFYNKKPEANGTVLHNGKPKEVIQNGYVNGKDKTANGKDRQTNKVKPAEKRPLPIQDEGRINTQSDDSDSKSDSFRPVENRRNRTQVNGGGKNKVQPLPLRVEIIEKAFEEPIKSMDKPAFEVKPVLERLDTTTSVKTESEKSSTLSELSSPTDLSSGQTTPPDTVVEEIQNIHVTDLSKSAEKLREGLSEKKSKKSTKKNKKNTSAGQRTEPKEEKVEPVLEELPPLPDFLQPPKNDIMDLDLSAALDHALLRSLRQNEPAISKINLFPPRTPTFPLDVYSKTNLSQMRAPRPEEFFASIVDTPVQGEILRLADKPRKAEKLSKVDMRPGVRKPINTAYKPSRKTVKEEEVQVEKIEKEDDKPETKLGIVDAVKTWLESQEGALSPSPLTFTTSPTSPSPLTNFNTSPSPSPLPEPEVETKNVGGNPQRAPSVEGEDRACSRVAESSPSPDLSALTDARASVDKYYTLSGRRVSLKSETSEVSEQEACDALEYVFPRPPALAPHTAQFPTKDLACKLQ